MQFLWRWLLSMRRERVQRKTLTSRRRVLIGTRRGLVRFSIERGRGDLISTQRRRMSTTNGRFKKLQKFCESIYARVAELVLGSPPPPPPGWSMAPHVTGVCVSWQAHHQPPRAHSLPIECGLPAIWRTTTKVSNRPYRAKLASIT